MKEKETQIVYHFGYRKQSIDELQQWMEMNKSAILVDVRYGSIHPGNMWSKQKLTKRFGDAYIHVKALGNANYKGTTIVIADPKLGLSILEAMMEEGFDPVLMCACEDYHDCHRKTIIGLLEDEKEIEVRVALASTETQEGFFNRG